MRIRVPLNNLKELVEKFDNYQFISRFRTKYDNRSYEQLRKNSLFGIINEITIKHNYIMKNGFMLFNDSRIPLYDLNSIVDDIYNRKTYDNGLDAYIAKDNGCLFSVQLKSTNTEWIKTRHCDGNLRCTYSQKRPDFYIGIEHISRNREYSEYDIRCARTDDLVQFVRKSDYNRNEYIFNKRYLDKELSDLF